MQLKLKARVNRSDGQDTLVRQTVALGFQNVI
jgi:hypothetical protein